MTDTQSLAPSAPNDTAHEADEIVAAAATDKPATAHSQDDASQPDKGEGPACKKQKKSSGLLLPATASAGAKLGTHDVVASPKQSGEKLNFAQRLMELLEKDDVKPYFHWCEDGRRIKFEDTNKFVTEVMPKYFSDIKYKSLMVRLKRWGFRVTTPHPRSDKYDGTKILECELFRRDKPHLCQLMGDERRRERVDASKAKKEKKTKSKRVDSTGAGAQSATHAAAATSAATPTSASRNQEETRSAAVTSGLNNFGVDLALLNHQRNLQNLQALNILSAHAGAGGGMLTGTNLVDLTSPTYLRSSNQGGISGPASMGQFDSLGEVANISLLSIEQDMQYSLEMIAIHQDRLSLLQHIREMKLSLAQRRSTSMTNY